MKIDTDSIFSISEANQNFSKVAKKVDDSGLVIILKNNKPKYVIKRFDDEDLAMTEQEKIEIIAQSIMKEHKEAFEELAK